MWRSRRGCLILGAALLIGAVPARAQPAARNPHPIGMELGASVAAHVDPAGSPSFSPRFSVSDGWTALEGFADIAPNRPFTRERERGRLMLYGQLKRKLVQNASGHSFVVIGMHAGQRLRQTGGFKPGQPPEIRRDWWPGFSIGGGYQVSLHRHLAVRTDAQFGTTFDGPLMRASLGLAVPMGMGIKTPAPRSEPSRPRIVGPTIWVTMSDGRALKGVLVRAGTNAIDFAHGGDVTTLPLDEIQLIQTTDRLGNGARAGAVLGGLGFGVWAYSSALNSSDSEAAPSLGLFSAGIGAGLGALIGMLVDGFAEGRRVVYRPGRSLDISVAPALSPNSAVLGARVQW